MTHHCLDVSVGAWKVGAITWSSKSQTSSTWVPLMPMSRERRVNTPGSLSIVLQPLILDPTWQRRGDSSADFASFSNQITGDIRLTSTQHLSLFHSDTVADCQEWTMSSRKQSSSALSPVRISTKGTTIYVLPPPHHTPHHFDRLSPTPSAWIGPAIQA